MLTVLFLIADPLFFGLAPPQPILVEIHVDDTMQAETYCQWWEFPEAMKIPHSPSVTFFFFIPCRMDSKLCLWISHQFEDKMDKEGFSSDVFESLQLQVGWDIIINIYKAIRGYGVHLALIHANRCIMLIPIIVDILSIYFFYVCFFFCERIRDMRILRMLSLSPWKLFVKIVNELAGAYASQSGVDYWQ